MATRTRLDNAPASGPAVEGTGSLTRLDVAALSLRYWWVAVALWVAYSAWMSGSVAHDLARYR